MWLWEEKKSSNMRHKQLTAHSHTLAVETHIHHNIAIECRRRNTWFCLWVQQPTIWHRARRVRKQENRARNTQTTVFSSSFFFFLFSVCADDCTQTVSYTASKAWQGTTELLSACVFHFLFVSVQFCQSTEAVRFCGMRRVNKWIFVQFSVFLLWMTCRSRE